MEHLNPLSIPCTKPLKINEHFQKFAEDVKKLAKAATINENLEETCSIKKLNFNGDLLQMSDKNRLSTTVQLSSLKSSAHLNIQRVKIKWDNAINREKVALSFPQEPNEGEELHRNDLYPSKDALLVVKYYKPFANSGTARIQAQYIAEFAILAKQSVTELRDKFKCVHDYYVSAELEHPDEKSICYTKDDFPSGFLFIENCFYNDMRHSKAIEYSKEIIDWAVKRGITEFTTGRMENTNIGDLKLRLGYPYLFQHQGNCEHLVVFTDARLLRSDELLDSKKYPYILSTNKFRINCCSMCQHSHADFLIMDCDRLPKKHNYMCKKCVLAYNYQNGEKVGRFKLYPHFDINLLTLF